MKILRVLNTNAIVTLDEKNQEIIVTGAGIGFKKKRGDLVDKSQIDKVYCLKNDEFNKRLQNIVENIPELNMPIFIISFMLPFPLVYSGLSTIY